MTDRIVVKVRRKMNDFIAEEQDGRITVVQPTGPLLSHIQGVDQAYMYAKLVEHEDWREIKPYRLAPYSEWHGAV